MITPSNFKLSRRVHLPLNLSSPSRSCAPQLLPPHSPQPCPTATPADLPGVLPTPQPPASMLRLLKVSNRSLVHGMKLISELRSIPATARRLPVLPTATTPAAIPLPNLPLDKLRQPIPAYSTAGVLSARFGSVSTSTSTSAAGSSAATTAAMGSTSATPTTHIFV